MQTTFYFIRRNTEFWFSGPQPSSILNLKGVHYWGLTRFDLCFEIVGALSFPFGLVTGIRGQTQTYIIARVKVRVRHRRCRGLVYKDYWTILALASSSTQTCLGKVFRQFKNFCFNAFLGLRRRSCFTMLPVLVAAKNASNLLTFWLMDNTKESKLVCPDFSVYDTSSLVIFNNWMFLYYWRINYMPFTDILVLRYTRLGVSFSVCRM